LGLPEEQAYVVLVPGARWETKRWPAASFAALAGLLLKDGAAVVLAGGKEDLPLGLEIAKRVREAEALSEVPVKKVAAASPRLVNLIGQTSLRELGALIQRSRFYISADTGPLFIATACKIPLIALYGPTRPDRTGPYGSSEATVLLTPAACAGCLKKKCEDWHCMTDITPEAVFKLYRQKLANLGGTKVGTES
jgi:heptosyltransferase-1/heptosyltransferase-2